MHYPPPNPIASLYLARSGPIVPLELDIRLYSKYWEKIEIDPKDYRRQVSHLPKLFNFLVSNGAHPSRWRSLFLNSSQLRIVFCFIKFMNEMTVPVLQLLSCRWDPTGLGLGLPRSERRNLANRRLFGDCYSLSGSSFPNLRNVHLITIPWRFVFDRPAPLLTDLVSLTLSAAFEYRLVLPSKVYSLLSRNTRLECLRIDSGFTPSSFPPIPLFSSRVCLTLLWRLTITIFTSARWILVVMHVIDAPNLEHLTLTIGHNSLTNSNIKQLMRYLATGAFPGNGIGSNAQSLMNNPIYPSLRSLDISRIRCRLKDIRLVLSAFETITHLTISHRAVKLLGKAPWLLPNLACLSLRVVPPGLVTILRRRMDAGYHVKTLKLAGSGRNKVIGDLPSGISIQVDPELGFCEKLDR